jgi:Ca2+-binding EF-hand superfamily protein
MADYSEQREVAETMQTVIKYSYNLLKEEDGLIHKRSIVQKLCDAELYYDPPYIYEVFDSVDETKDGILTLDEFTNFYHIINQKGDCVRQHKQNDVSNDFDFSDIAIGFVIVGVTAAGALFFANKLRK